MQADKRFTLRNIGDIFFILPSNPADFPATDCMLTTNRTGAVLWDLLQQQTSLESLTAFFQNTYHIDEQTAAEDITCFLEELRKINAINDF